MDYVYFVSYLISYPLIMCIFFIYYFPYIDYVYFFLI